MPLHGIRVLDFSRHLPGPYATDLLFRLGAEVIKVEPPDGDPTRWIPPFSGPFGALFTLINAGKESVVVDLKREEGRAFVHRLVPSCDVVVESYRPGVAQEFGIDRATLLALNPRLIYCSITGFGQASARSGHDLNFVALAGLLDLQRDASGNPVLPSTQIGDMSGALFAAISILAALFERQRSGRGRAIDISMSDATRAVMPTAESLYRGTHQTPETFALTGALPGYHVYRTSDGRHIAVAPLEPRFWATFCAAIGHPEMIDEQFDAASRESHFEKIRRAIASRTRAEWEAVFAPLDACVEPVLTIEEAHVRFGDPIERHPLTVNFSPREAEVEAPGASLGRIAAEAGYDERQIRAMKNDPAFRTGDRLHRFVANAITRLRYRSFFGSSD